MSPPKPAAKTLKPESRNIEIKARLGNDEQFDRRVKIARKLTLTDGEIIHQRDVFYNVAEGRLKLRYLKVILSKGTFEYHQINRPIIFPHPQDDTAQLVQYSRPDVAGPKLSQFDVMAVEEPDKLNRMLTASLGVRGEVRKVRYLFMLDQTRIHLDRVEGLGNFLEFEVCLEPEQSVELGTMLAEQLIDVFHIEKHDLLKGAYLDDLLKK